MQKASRSAGSSSNAGVDGLQDAALFLLAFGVELIELVGNLASAGRIFHAEEFDDVAGNIHAAGGIDARRDAESDFARSERSAARLARLRATLSVRD